MNEFPLRVYAGAMIVLFGLSFSFNYSGMISELFAYIFCAFGLLIMNNERG